MGEDAISTKRDHVKTLREEGRVLKGEEKKMEEKKKEQTSTSLSVGGLELVDLGVVIELDTELKELLGGLGEILKELVGVLGVDLDPLAELLVLGHSHVGGQHHQRLGLLILELLGAIPLALNPLAVQKLSVEVVGEDSGRGGPGAVETRAVLVAASESVGTEKGDNLLIVEAHLVENITRVLAVRTGSVGETTIWGRVGLLAINASGSPVNDGSTLIAVKNSIAKRVLV